MQTKVVYCLLGCLIPICNRRCEMDTNCYIQARGKCPAQPLGHVNLASYF